MTDEEMVISRSTVDIRFRCSRSARPRHRRSAEGRSPGPGRGSRNRRRNTPVVLYALEWCEFCWSVRRMFQDAEIDYLSVDLDSAAYREDNRGGRIRAALREITGSPTIPQIFVGGELIGGATETFDAYNSGKLKELLDKQSIEMIAAAENAYGYLPKVAAPPVDAPPSGTPDRNGGPGGRRF